MTSSSIPVKIHNIYLIPVKLVSDVAEDFDMDMNDRIENVLK